MSTEVQLDHCERVRKSAEGLAAARLAILESLYPVRDAAEAVIRAFEALGKTNNIAAQIDSHRAAENAMVRLKAELKRSRDDSLPALPRVSLPVGFQLRSRAHREAPWNEWGSPQPMEYERHYLSRPETFEIRYVYP